MEKLRIYIIKWEKTHGYMRKVCTEVICIRKEDWNLLHKDEHEFVFWQIYLNLYNNEKGKPPISNQFRIDWIGLNLHFESD